MPIRLLGLAAPLIVPLILLASCGTGSDKDKSASTPPARQTLNERFSGGGGRDPNSFQRDSNGKLKINEAKRSPFESQGESHLSNKSFKKQDYKAGDYAKKSWWGNKEYDRQSYAGNTDGSQFKKSSGLADKGANEAGNQARIPDNYRTGNYATGDSRESTTRSSWTSIPLGNESETNGGTPTGERRSLPTTAPWSSQCTNFPSA